LRHYSSGAGGGLAAASAAAGSNKLTKHGAFSALMLVNIEDRLGWAAVQGKPVGPTGLNLGSTWDQPGVNHGINSDLTCSVIELTVVLRM